MGHDKSDHDCRKNFQGSAKAMEANAGVQLINHSEILIESKLQVRFIVGDEDSSMIAAVRRDNPVITFHKLADKNHLLKNFSSELYNMRSLHKEMNKKGVIAHIKKCFAYAVAQNKGDCERLRKELKRLPDHFYGRHENCGFWCKYKDKHTLTLTNNELYEKLVQLLNKYAANAAKFSVAASSQTNKSFNNVVAHKAHKNQCLSTTATCDVRVGDSVCTWNDGEKAILNFRTRLGFEEQCFSALYAEGADRKRLKRKLANSSHAKKLRKIQLKQNREALRQNQEKTEGITYQSNCGFNSQIEMPVERECVVDRKVKLVFFDLKTTGLDKDADIVQIAAKCGKFEFDSYVGPTKDIS
ncbi:uncharacterized protein LOC131673999 [Phymastichus coffea]|uniref:uncharacterized protein LOC131673999 n=1 Tax=Phymastichus coffea TaxID=108790 RepID=UPI00273BD258|nr:uncharacterized protein LOC131673999 [Phymastichus coffea]